MSIELQLITLLFLKHFIVDFPLQTRFQYSNKGNYGHVGGVLHAVLHAFGTFGVFWFYRPDLAASMALIDMFIHYHVDWAKVTVNTHFGLKPDNSEKYWWFLGFDQLLHSLTYIGLVVVSV